MEEQKNHKIKILDNENKKLASKCGRKHTKTTQEDDEIIEDESGE